LVAGSGFEPLTFGL